MEDSLLRIATILGSTREGRFGDKVARWFVGRAALLEEVNIDFLDLAEIKLPASLSSVEASDLATMKVRVAAADAFVIITPEYNHGYPSALKLALDSLREEWKAKPVSFVSYGGVSGGLRAVEQLRQVCAELHMATLRDTVSFHNYAHLFDELGRLKAPEQPNIAAAVMLEQLVWWARALQEARARRPYRV